MTRLKSLRFRFPDSPEFLAEAWRLRLKFSPDGLGWDVPSGDPTEFDSFDLDAVHVGVTARDRLVGYWRLLDTAGPCLLKAQLPGLPEDWALPRSSRLWQASRFAVRPHHPDGREIGRMLVREAMACGRDLGAERLVAVAQPPLERFLRRHGLAVERVAGPVTVARDAGGRDIRAVLISWETGLVPLADAPPAERRAA